MSKTPDAYRALLDRESLGFIGKLSQETLAAVINLLIMKDMTGNPMYERLASLTLEHSGSIDGFRSEQIKEILKGVADKPDGVFGLIDGTNNGKEKGGKKSSLWGLKRE